MFLFRSLINILLLAGYQNKYNQCLMNITDVAEYDFFQLL